MEYQTKKKLRAVVIVLGLTLTANLLIDYYCNKKEYKYDPAKSVVVYKTN